MEISIPQEKKFDIKYTEIKDIRTDDRNHGNLFQGFGTKNRDTSRYIYNVFMYIFSNIERHYNPHAFGN